MTEQPGYNEMRAWVAERMKQDARSEVYAELGADGAVIRRQKAWWRSSTMRWLLATVLALGSGLVTLWGEGNLTPATAAPLVAGFLTTIGAALGRKRVGDLKGGPTP